MQKLQQKLPKKFANIIINKLNKQLLEWSNSQAGVSTTKAVNAVGVEVPKHEEQQFDTQLVRDHSI